MRARRRRGCLALAGLAAAALGALWFGRAALLTALGSALVEDDGPHRAQAAVVLGGDDYGTRIVKAAELAEAGYARVVIVSGPANLLGHESDTTMEYARRKGFSSALFEAAPNATDSTREEAKFLGAFLKARGIHTILLVTSSFHTRRAARLMRSENPGLRVWVTAAPDPYFTPAGWWKSRNGKKTLLLEWMKTAASWVGM